jgi:hypothetical protein
VDRQPLVRVLPVLSYPIRCYFLNLFNVCFRIQPASRLGGLLWRVYIIIELLSISSSTKLNRIEDSYDDT